MELLYVTIKVKFIILMVKAAIFILISCSYVKFKEKFLLFLFLSYCSPILHIHIPVPYPLSSPHIPIIYSYSSNHNIISTSNKSAPTQSTTISPTAAIHHISTTFRPNNTKRPPINLWNRNFIEFRSETRRTRIRSKTLDNLRGSLQQTHWKRAIQSNREALFVYVCL